MQCVESLKKLQTWQIVGTILYHLSVSLRSLTYHTICHQRAKRHANTLCVSYTEGQKVVLFVHGRNGSPTDFLPLIANIRHQNLFGDSKQEHCLHTVDLGDTGHTTTLDEDAEKLNLHIRYFYKNRSINLVGLSKGGLVVLCYAPPHSEADDNNNRINQLITISAPVQGIYSASLFPPSSSVFFNLSYKNALVQKIEERCKTFNNIYHIVPTWDSLIVPTSLNTMFFNYYGYSYGHTGIAFNPQVAEVIAKWILK